VLEPDAEYNANSLNNKHDKGYKYLLSTKRIFLQLLKSFLKQSWVQKIDENSIEKIDKSFILQDFNEKEADIIYKVKIDGKEVFFYILFRTWLKNIVVYTLPKEQAAEIGKIIDESWEVEEMEYALGLSIYKEIKQAELKGKLAGKLEGIQEGIKEGKLEGKLEVAKKLLAAGMEIEQVSVFTELPVEEIQKLIDENQK